MLKTTIVQAATEVDAMQKDLQEAKKVVEAATAECNALLEVIAKSTGDVEVKQSAALQKEADLKVISPSWKPYNIVTTKSMYIICDLD